MIDFVAFVRIVGTSDSVLALYRQFARGTTILDGTGGKMPLLSTSRKTLGQF